MLMATRGITGKELADDLLQGVSSEQMRAATRLLGAHHDGYWLRRFFEDQELADAAGQPLLDHAGPHPSIDWNAVGLLLLADSPRHARRRAAKWPCWSSPRPSWGAPPSNFSASSTLSTTPSSGSSCEP